MTCRDTLLIEAQRSCFSKDLDLPSSLRSDAANANTTVDTELLPK